MAELEGWIADNYRALISDPNRGETAESVAVWAESKGAPDLAAWARRVAAESGSDVTPRAAKLPAKSVRASK